ncbi:sensor histidine kinase [Alkalihalobacillus oceani]|uniref:sensor histidine kinase n=1 Tax=Halalkalibacter oceani TaxID=1653776 RepID=UPI00203AD3F8|nr:sensor histidine kinase [Halalkalibacter oceani]MCM3761957.1 sensor histidine kinase [Halalkalibacter oceani]
MRREMVQELCLNYTNLSAEDIEVIQGVAANLQLIADLNKANIFIDCLTKEGQHAIVVAEASPATALPVYENPVVGKFAYEAFEPAVFNTLRTGKPMFQNRALTQEGRTVEQSVVPLLGPRGRVIGTVIMEKASEELHYQQKVKALSEANETLSEMLIGITEQQPILPEVMEDSIFFINDQGELFYTNRPAINLIHEIGGEGKVGNRLTDYFPEVAAILEDEEEVLVSEIPILDQIFQVKKIPLTQLDHDKSAIVILKNITELREKERELLVKTVTLREVHHRVKNNLQTVASLLRLQMKRGLPEESKVYFAESLNRITSIAAVYEIILANSNVDVVDLYQLVEKIGNALVGEAEREEKKIELSYSGIPVQIESSKAVTIALIINELIQNCVKHAFDGMDKGQVDVTFTREGDRFLIRVTDDGKGFAPEARSSLGLDIVTMLIEHDLAGEFSIRQMEAGTVATVDIPLNRELVLR